VPLAVPVLDDRSYEQLRDELVARIPVYTPEWTDHHDTDPGVTLLELFAFLGEFLLRRRRLLAVTLVAVSGVAVMLWLARAGAADDEQDDDTD
jgi:hypothetical protein